MLSFEPVDLRKTKPAEINKEILRLGMIAELDAISLYEQLAAVTNSADIKKVLLDIAKEEKTHVAEFETLLHREDKEQLREQEAGRKEIQKLTRK